MKVLVLGATGMLGHVVYTHLSNNGHDVLGVSRTPSDGLNTVKIDVWQEHDKLVKFMLKDSPDVVINCIGVLIKESEGYPARAIYLNSLFPHLLSDLCVNCGAKLIHISTDCIFNGEKGPYKESDFPTETNWYGRTKALGELNNTRDLTLRTSIIGPDLDPVGVGLFNWFSKQKGSISGYTDVFWNGITTLECAKQIERIITSNPELSGLYHLTTSEAISKYDLLKAIHKIFGPFHVTITPLDKIKQNKVLVNTRKDYQPRIPSYEKQLQELKKFIKENNYAERV